jgi:hypothetical protein
MQIEPQCHSCKHYEGAFVCAAYDRIPDAIIIKSSHDHTKEFPGDNGIRFEPLEESEGS